MTTTADLVKWARKAGGTISTAEVLAAGFHSQALTRLVRAGTLQRISPGVYRLPGAEVSAWHGLVLATMAAPDAVVCLLSALAFHGVGTQLPDSVWLALERGRHTPRVDDPRTRFVHLSGEAFTAGIEEHSVEGHALPVYDLPKTLADCFKFRNRIGLDVAIEALADSWRNRRIRAAQIEPYAKICRVDRVMRPYLEMLAE
jgi:predicted transcriptional regulator of viral defense system